MKSLEKLLRIERRLDELQHAIAESPVGGDPDLAARYAKTLLDIGRQVPSSLSNDVEETREWSAQCSELTSPAKGLAVAVFAQLAVRHNGLTVSNITKYLNSLERQERRHCLFALELVEPSRLRILLLTPDYMLGSIDTLQTWLGNVPEIEELSEAAWRFKQDPKLRRKRVGASLALIRSFKDLTRADFGRLVWVFASRVEELIASAIAAVRRLRRQLKKSSAKLRTHQKSVQKSRSDPLVVSTLIIDAKLKKEGGIQFVDFWISRGRTNPTRIPVELRNFCHVLFAAILKDTVATWHELNEGGEPRRKASNAARTSKHKLEQILMSIGTPPDNEPWITTIKRTGYGGNSSVIWKSTKKARAILQCPLDSILEVE